MAQSLKGRMADARIGDTGQYRRLSDVAALIARQDCRSDPDDRAKPPGRLPVGEDTNVDTMIQACADRIIAPDYDAPGFRAWVASRADVGIVDMALTVLTLTARKLGDMWLEDDCTFNDVTIGMHRLTLLLIALEPPTGDPLAQPQHGGRIFVAPAPGDQHGFGLAMVGFFLRRAGWDVSAELNGDESYVLDRIAARDYDCIGFSVGHERAIAPVAALIQQVRRRSRRRSVKIVVGGPMIVADPGLGKRMAADIWAQDAMTLIDQLLPFVPEQAV